MKMKTTQYASLFLLLSLMILVLAGCAQSADQAATSELDVTQAYQTIEARLTQAVAQTPLPPTMTSTPETVEATTTPTLEPTQVATTPAEPTATFLPTFTPTIATSCDKAEAAYPSIDITVPDNTEIPAGNSFTKVWRVVNTGTCNWTAAYSAVFFSGDQMSAPASVAISEPVAPGQSVDIDVTMVAPQEEGTYRGYWKLENANGQQFGIGNSGNDAFWVQIVVSAEIITPTATLAPTDTPAPTPQTLVSGSATLNANEGLDLDTLQIGAGDLTYQQISDGTNITGHQLVPTGGATAGIFGAGQPTYVQCQNTAKSAGPIDIDTNTGAYLCYFTDQGLIGWASIDALDIANGQVRLTILTWAGQ